MAPARPGLRAGSGGLETQEDKIYVGLGNKNGKRRKWRPLHAQSFAGSVREGTTGGATHNAWGCARGRPRELGFRTGTLRSRTRTLGFKTLEPKTRALGLRTLGSNTRALVEPRK